MKGNLFIYGFIALLITILMVNILVPIVKPIAVQKAYDAQQAYTITNSTGGTLTITPDTTVSYTQISDLWDMVLPVANIFLALAALVLAIMGVVKLIKHE
jgi:hypothetical protein